MTESMEKEAFVVEKFEPVSVPPAFKTVDGVYLSNLGLCRTLLFQHYIVTNQRQRTSNNNASEVIKQALAEVIVHYYPFVGKFGIDSERKLVINCIGEGAIFVKAVADCDLDLIVNVTNLNFAILGKLVHTYLISQNILELPLLTIQVTRFKCGGFVLGVANNHCIAYGIAASEFLSFWAELARGSPMTVFPFLNRSIMRSNSEFLGKICH